MPVDDLKDIDQREWPLDPLTLPDPADPGTAVKLIVTRTRTTKDLGLPTQTVTDRWEAEVLRARSRQLVCAAPTMAEFDSQLNTLRQAIVDARSLLAAMNA